MFSKLKTKRIKRRQHSFAYKYRHCERCSNELNVQDDEEFVCVLCGETFCKTCIGKHQAYCYA